MKTDESASIFYVIVDLSGKHRLAASGVFGSGRFYAIRERPDGGNSDLHISAS